MRLRSLFAALASAWLALAGSARAQTDFVAFETGQVRPLCLSPDGTRLFAVNTPDNQLEIFDVSASGLTWAGSVPVGMEPVAVAARTNTEVWVVNHLSDSVSIVDLSSSPARVVRTLLVGDEPRDIVFANPSGNRAFISTAHRGQHRTDASIAGVPGAGDPQLTTEGIGRADVWVFDATSLGTALGGTPVRIVTFFADTPRALAVSANGNTVYAAAFQSGNQTTAITETSVPDGFGATGAPGPDDNSAGDPAPEVGVIVKWNGSQWLDADGTNWTASVKFSLPDHDVFSIDATTLASGSVQQFDHVGTILFNMVVNPVTGKLYVTNTELPNHVLFEGPGNHGGSTVQGHLSESRITVINPGTSSVDPQHLNQHIDYSKLHTDVPDVVDTSQVDHSLATPVQPVVSSDGSTIYVAAFGSSKIGVFTAADIEDPAFETNFDPTLESANYLSTTAGGPSGLALDEARNRLYVLTRFNNGIEVLDLDTGNSVQIVALHNPEPQSVVEGRPFLYDAVLTSGNGEASCSSCHIFGDLDGLAWNLGNPDEAVSLNTQPEAIPILPSGTEFHPMKGPMTTQTLRGLGTHGALHWRGDRVDGFFGTDNCTLSAPDGPCSEAFSFNNFIAAFEGLVGGDAQIVEPQGNVVISAADMQKFTNFTLQIRMPPNPVRNLDHSLTAAQSTGQTIFNTVTSDTVATCSGCHTLQPQNGFFGTGGRQSFEGEPQFFKVAHMRNLYAKVGMFGMSTSAGNTGEQVRGFGFLHDGSVDTVFDFLAAPVFNLDDVTQQPQVEQFSLVFPTDFAPIVGQQITLTSTGNAAEMARVQLLIDRSKLNYNSLPAGGNVPECNLVVKGTVGGQPRGWWRESGDNYRDDHNNLIADAALRALANTDGPLTYTCVPPGSGVRAGINRDRDIVLDGLDNCPAVANDDQADSDTDGIGDACEAAIADSDADGVDDSLDNCPLVPNPLQENFDGDALGDVCDADDDADGLLDTVETNTGTFNGPGDTGTSPFDADTDNDGFADGFEVDNGTDPTNPLSFPGAAKVPAVGLLGRTVLSLALAGLSLGALRRRGRAGPA